MKSKSKKVLLTILLMLFAIIIIGCDNNAENKTQSFSAQEVEQIHINTVGESIELISSESDQVRVSLKTSSPLSAVLNDGVLTILVDAPSKYINFKSKTLYVEVPSKIYEAINLTSASGNISFKEIKSKEITVSTDSGNITIQGFKGEVEAVTDSGKMSSSLPIASFIKPQASGYILKSPIEQETRDPYKLNLHSVSGNLVLD